MKEEHVKLPDIFHAHPSNGVVQTFQEILFSNRGGFEVKEYNKHLRPLHSLGLLGLGGHLLKKLVVYSWRSDN